jgi:hypothetical protein
VTAILRVNEPFREGLQELNAISTMANPVSSIQYEKISSVDGILLEPVVTTYSPDFLSTLPPSRT